MASAADFFTVVVRDQRFVLSRSQINFDAPNYFTMCFLGDFAESISRQVELSRDPYLFRIIVDYLCGYTIFPIRQDVLPPTMTPEVALANLRADAVFYQLEGLLAAIKEINDSPPNLLVAKIRRQHMFRTRFKVVGWTESPDTYATYGKRLYTDVAACQPLKCIIRYRGVSESARPITIYCWNTL